MTVGLTWESRTIGRHVYHVGQMPCGRARKLFFRITKVAGPALARLLEGDVKSIRDLSLKQVGDAIQTLALNASEEDFEYVVAQCFEGDFVKVEKNGGRPVVDPQMMEIHFAGHLPEMFRVIGFVLEVNFRGFFGAKSGGGEPAPGTSS